MSSARAVVAAMAAVAAVVITGCGPSERERDCAEMRAMLEPHANDRPRRYYDYGKAPADTARIVDLALLGCGRSDRERDCAKVRAILDPPRTGGAPRRDYDYSQAGADAPFVDMTPFERLRQLELRDREVREAVHAMVDDAIIQTYSPYRVQGAPSSAADRVADLCGLRRLTIVEAP
jgi:hypothetical protein